LAADQDIHSARTKKGRIMSLLKRLLTGAMCAILTGTVATAGTANADASAPDFGARSISGGMSTAQADWL